MKTLKLLIVEDVRTDRAARQIMTIVLDWISTRCPDAKLLIYDFVEKSVEKTRAWVNECHPGGKNVVIVNCVKEIPEDSTDGIKGNSVVLLLHNSVEGVIEMENNKNPIVPDHAILDMQIFRGSERSRSEAESADVEHGRDVIDRLVAYGVRQKNIIVFSGFVPEIEEWLNQSFPYVDILEKGWNRETLKPIVFKSLDKLLPSAKR